MTITVVSEAASCREVEVSPALIQTPANDDVAVLSLFWYKNVAVSPPPPDAASTYAVLAIAVLSSPELCVGQVGVPVKAGLAKMEDPLIL